MKKLKIVMLSRHGCMRVMKVAIPLIENGHEVHLITNKVTQYSEVFNSVLVYQDVNQLYNAIKVHKDADIFHGHNEPSWFVTAVKDQFFDKPVVLDVHDSHLLRRTDEECIEDPDKYRVSAEERNNLQLADALVYVSKSMERIVGGEFKIGVPTIVLPSYVPLQFYRLDFLRWWGGLCYEGRIDITDELPKQWDFFQYSNYLDLAKKCREIGIDFHVYTTRNNAKVRKQYDEVCYLHEPEGYERLIKVIGQHDWGLVGNIKKFPEWDNALPNKFFEYMAACLPIVSINAKESSELIKEYGVGITVGSMEELAERWKEHRPCRANVIKHRQSFSMENHIGKLEDLYSQLV